MKSAIQMISLSDLTVDLAVQRQLNKHRAVRMSWNFDWDLFGVITVSSRSDGRYVVLDGQHRVEAARLAGYGDAKVSCEVFSNLNVEHEAGVFLGRQQFKIVSAIDEYRVLKAKKDPMAEDIERIVQSHGWRVDRKLKADDGRAISAIRALETLWRRDQNGERRLIDRTLGILTKAWGHDRDAVTATLLTGMGGFIATYGEKVNDARLSDRLAKHTTAATFAGAARLRRGGTGGSLANAATNEIRDIYNRGLSERNKLL